MHTAQGRLQQLYNKLDYQTRVNLHSRTLARTDFKSQDRGATYLTERSAYAGFRLRAWAAVQRRSKEQIDAILQPSMQQHEL